MPFHVLVQLFYKHQPFAKEHITLSNNALLCFKEAKDKTIKPPYILKTNW